MLNIRLLTTELTEKWNTYVIQHHAASPYHLSAWKDAVEQGYGHQCYYWIATNKENNIVGVLPTAWVKPPLLRGNLCALPFCDIGGVLANDETIKAELLATAQNFCNDHNIPKFDHRSCISTAISADSNKSKGEKVRMLMALPSTSEDLFAGFKSKLRSQIRKAEKNGLTASTGTDKTHLDNFYKVFSRNMRDLGSPVHSKKWFEELLSAYDKNIIITNVWLDNIIVGAGIVLIAGNKACIPWASTNADYNKLAPNMLLYWTLLKYVTDQGCKVFDFGRSTLDEGTFKFKSQWGATPYTLEWQQYNKSGEIFLEAAGDTNKLREMVEQVWKKIPVGLSEFIGPKIRKYISL